jgi:hypothetical protein
MSTDSIANMNVSGWDNMKLILLFTHDMCNGPGPNFRAHPDQLLLYEHTAMIER